MRQATPELDMLFQPPALDDLDVQVVEQIDTFRRDMRYALREPRRWTGQLRRNLLAKAIQGSNSIEGYDVSDEDAVAAVEEEEPLSADEATWAEIRGYRTAMSYVLQLADDPHFELDQSLIRSLHYMMLAHDVMKSPGRYRLNSVFVVDGSRDEVVCEGPDFQRVPELCQELVETIPQEQDAPNYVRAAMAHLNLVMIHPFRDGNGRMARCLQTLILARDSIVAPNSVASKSSWEIIHRTTTQCSARSDRMHGTPRTQPDPGRSSSCELITCKHRQWSDGSPKRHTCGHSSTNSPDVRDYRRGRFPPFTTAHVD